MVSIKSLRFLLSTFILCFFVINASYSKQRRVSIRGTESFTRGLTDDDIRAFKWQMRNDSFNRACKIFDRGVNFFFVGSLVTLIFMRVALYVYEKYTMKKLKEPIYVDGVPIYLNDILLKDELSEEDQVLLAKILIKDEENLSIEVDN